MSPSIHRALSLLAVAVGAFVAPGARAVPVGPLLLVAPSSIESEDQSIDVTPTGSLSLDVDAVPIASPQLFRLTDVAIAAGSFQFTLDPTLASPALGLVQPDGSFEIPTLFLRGNDGASDFDLAIPNVTGLLLGAPGGVTGLFAEFEIESGLGQLVRVALHAAVPEPGTVLLLSLGCAALALRARREVAR